MSRPPGPVQPRAGFPGQRYRPDARRVDLGRLHPASCHRHEENGEEARPQWIQGRHRRDRRAIGAKLTCEFQVVCARANVRCSDHGDIATVEGLELPVSRPIGHPLEDVEQEGLSVGCRFATSPRVSI